jgi:hypothetical protein
MTASMRVVRKVLGGLWGLLPFFVTGNEFWQRLSGVLWGLPSFSVIGNEF